MRSILLVLLFLVPVQLFAQALSVLEKRLEREGFVNVQKVDTSIRVSLMYARSDNFVGKVLYTDLYRAYLLPETAKALAKAQKKLKEERADLSLIVFDATRPMSVQRAMWNAVKGTSMQKYVSNPANGGGLHNYGLAVDVSLCDAKGDTIPMGSVVDYLGKEANTADEALRCQKGTLSKEAYENRRLLRKVMTEAGFKVLAGEWWHFNFKTRAEAKRSYKVVK